MVMNNRKHVGAAGTYRFGYNGAEKDDEVAGNDNSYSTDYRQYDVRLGRWKTIDPKWQHFPEHSPYNTQFNNPVYWNDPKGDCPPCWAAARWLLQRAIPLFVAGAAVSMGTQLAGNYIMYEDAKKAVMNIDIVDVAAEGSINVITGGAGSLRTFFKQGTTVAISKFSSVVVLELVSASTDYTFEGSKFESVFWGDKSLFEATSSLVLSLGGEYTARQIKGMFKNWAKKDMLPSNFAPKTKDEKEMVKKIDKLVKSESFQSAVDKGTSIMEEYVDAILGSGVNMEVKKVEERNPMEVRTDALYVAPCTSCPQK